MKILIAGTANVSSLELSYKRAAETLGHEVSFFNTDAEMRKSTPFGRIGYKLQEHIFMENWVRIMNRRLAILVKNQRPDMVLIFASAKILYGTIATIKTVSSAKVVLVWPDTPMNLRGFMHQAAGVYDLCAVYSSEAITSFKKLGFVSAVWIPLAGDPEFHGVLPVTEKKYSIDLSFVGMWRPEREKYLSLIAEKFPDLKVEIHGLNWNGKQVDPKLKKLVKGTSLVGKDLGNYFNSSMINLNVIDDTNYPAANMRFFEIPTAGGLQLTSSCPEQEGIFIDRKHCLYFNNPDTLVEQINWIMNHQRESDDIRKNGHDLIAQSNTYTHRLKAIVKQVFS